MKKILIILSIIILIGIYNKDERIIIPSSSIRFRVIASSSSIEDQLIKNKVSTSVIDYISKLNENVKTKEEAEENIVKNLSVINNIIENYTNNYNISFGNNLFPKKEYKGVEYPAGYYESLVINLGNASGTNWWCCIYPSLCTIDPNVTKAEYTTLVKEMLDKV